MKILIVDDEAPARQKLVRILSEVQPDAALTEAADGLEAMAILESETMDLLFLDIQMPGMSGLELVEAFGPEDLPSIVFTTAYDQYAIEAFELGAVDYLLKPFDQARLEKAFYRVQQTKPQLTPEILGKLLELNTPSAPLERIMVRENNKIIPVVVTDIQWMEADDKYVRIHTDRSKHYLRHTISGLEKRLDPARFIRCHRSAIVNLDAIAQLESLTHGDYQIKLKDGHTLTLSRRYSARLKDLLIE